MKIKTFQFNPVCVNTYVIYDESGAAAVIDCGCLYDNENEQLQRFIADNKLTIERALNTHLHLDHSFGNYMLAQTYGVLPEAHQADEFLVDSIVRDAKFFGIPGEVHPQKLGNYLHDGDIIKVGEIELKVIHTPGHTPGGVCFYCEKEGILFSGDTLFYSSMGRTDLPGGDFDAIIDSIQHKILTLPADTRVFCGHGMHTTIGAEQARW